MSIRITSQDFLEADWRLYRLDVHACGVAGTPVILDEAPPSQAQSVINVGENRTDTEARLYARVGDYVLLLIVGPVITNRTTALYDILRPTISSIKPVTLPDQLMAVHHSGFSLDGIDAEQSDSVTLVSDLGVFLRGDDYEEVVNELMVRVGWKAAPAIQESIWRHPDCSPASQWLDTDHDAVDLVDLPDDLDLFYVDSYNRRRTFFIGRSMGAYNAPIPVHGARYEPHELSCWEVMIDGEPQYLLYGFLNWPMESTRRHGPLPYWALCDSVEDIFDQFAPTAMTMPLYAFLDDAFPGIEDRATLIAYEHGLRFQEMRSRELGGL